MLKHIPNINPILAQWLFTHIGETILPCQNVKHQNAEKTTKATWESRIYHDYEATASLLDQGIPDEEVNQLAWETTCREQDEIGIVVHKTMYLCDSCAHEVVTTHSGINAANLAIMMAISTGEGLLLASNRSNAHAGIVFPLPRDIEEDELLELLRRQMVDLRARR